MIAPQEEVAAQCWTAVRMRMSTRWHFSIDDDVRRDADNLVEWANLPILPVTDPVAALRANSVTTAGIDKLADAVLSELLDGTGVALIKAHTLSDEAFRLVYMKLGLALGTPIETYGRLYEVKDVGVSYRENAVPVSQTHESTGMHTDSSGKYVIPRIVGLACVRSAPRGGDSRLVSVAQVHERLREKPQLLARLYEDFVRDIVTPGSERDPARVAENRFPVFSYPGRLCFRYMRYWIERGHARVGEALDAETREALDTLDAELAAPEHVLVFRMASKEMLFIDNARIAHDRDAYEDDPASPRLMLRLWLAGPLEETYSTCPECHAPWNLHWVYEHDAKDAEAIARGAELHRRRYNTCGWTREQLAAKWIHGKVPPP